MGKATQKTSPVSLGTKRACPECGTKFYDFNKEEIVCPKCETKVDLNAVGKSETKRAKPPKEIPEEALMETEDVVVAEGSDDFESVEDLDDEEDLPDDIGVDEDGEDF